MLVNRRTPRRDRGGKSRQGVLPVCPLSAHLSWPDGSTSFLARGTGPTEPPTDTDQVRTRATILGVILPTILILDIATKRWAMASLAGRSIELLGGFVPLTLAFNRGAAFGLSIGNDPRWFFIPVTLLALILLSYLITRTSPSDRFRLLALSLVFSGAVGNLIDRLRWSGGVVDFIGPIDLGFMDWPIFNVADMAISCGAVALAISFWVEDEAGSASPSDAPLEEEPRAAG